MEAGCSNYSEPLQNVSSLENGEIKQDNQEGKLGTPKQKK